MDAKCPFTAPIETQRPPPRAMHGAQRPPPGGCMAPWPRCPAVTPGGGSRPSFRLPHSALQHFQMSASVAWIWGTGEGGAEEWLESGATRQAKLSVDATCPLPAWGSEVAQGLWPPGPALYPWSSLCTCQNKVNPLREGLKKLVQGDVSGGCSFDALSPCPRCWGQAAQEAGRAARKSCRQAGHLRGA